MLVMRHAVPCYDWQWLEQWSMLAVAGAWSMLTLLLGSGAAQCSRPLTGLTELRARAPGRGMWRRCNELATLQFMAPPAGLTTAGRQGNCCASSAVHTREVTVTKLARRNWFRLKRLKRNKTELSLNLES